MENSDDIRIFDAKNDRYIQAGKISINSKDKAFLQCLYKADRYLTTRDISERTGISRNLINYRYDKFGRKQYTELVDVRTVDSSKLPKKLEDMKEAKLTEKGKNVLENGLIGDLSEDYISEKIVLSQEEFENQQEKISKLQETVEEQRTQIMELKQDIQYLQGEISYLNNWRDYASEVIDTVRSSMDFDDVGFNEESEGDGSQGDNDE
jgi:flagellar motility protein MotE (MotC chaperone)